MSASAAPLLTEAEARAEICRVGLSLYARGYVHATAGNISVRLADGFLITPTDACLGQLDPARLARVDSQGQHVAGDPPSKTLTLHREIYAATEAAGEPATCVIHTHSTHLVACSLLADSMWQGPASFEQGQAKPGTMAEPTADRTGGDSRAEIADELLPPLTPYFVMKVGHVPHLPYGRPGSQKVARQVADTITRYAGAGTPIRAVMLARLGPNVWHQTPAQALAVLEELEETARLALLTHRQVQPLSAAHIAELNATFGARW